MFQTHVGKNHVCLSRNALFFDSSLEDREEIFWFYSLSLPFLKKTWFWKDDVSRPKGDFCWLLVLQHWRCFLYSNRCFLHRGMNEADSCCLLGNGEKKRTGNMRVYIACLRLRTFMHAHTHKLIVPCMPPINCQILQSCKYALCIIMYIYIYTCRTSLTFPYTSRWMFFRWSSLWHCDWRFCGIGSVFALSLGWKVFEFLRTLVTICVVMLIHFAWYLLAKFGELDLRSRASIERLVFDSVYVWLQREARTFGVTSHNNRRINPYTCSRYYTLQKMLHYIIHELKQLQKRTYSFRSDSAHMDAKMRMIL